MILVELSPIPTASLPITAFADHLHLGTGFSDNGVQNDVLEAYLRTALSVVESRTGQALLEKNFSWQVTRWHNGNSQGLPVRPVQSISNLKTFNHVGSETLHSGTIYALRKDSQSPAIVSVGGALPNIPTGGGAEIEFVAGYGTSWEQVPADLAQAVILLAAHFYEHRTGDVGQSGGLPNMVLVLLEPYRPVRISGQR